MRLGHEHLHIYTLFEFMLRFGRFRPHDGLGGCIINDPSFSNFGVTSTPELVVLVVIVLVVVVVAVVVVVLLLLLLLVPACL